MIYEPAEDSFLLASCVSKEVKGKRVLDLCTGSGIQASTALKYGAKNVLAADIQEEAVEYVRKQGITAVRSNLFDNVKGEFDVIICNPPYLPKDNREDKKSARITSGGRKGDELILRVLRSSPKHLTPKGCVLLVVSSITPQNRIRVALRKNYFLKQVLAKQKLFMEQLEVWKLTLAPQ